MRFHFKTQQRDAESIRWTDEVNRSFRLTFGSWLVGRFINWLTHPENRFNSVSLMKKLFIPIFLAALFIATFDGCIAIGTGPKSQQTNATLGQQLIDLQKAKATGAITDAEYEAQKAKLLGETPGNNAAK
jgi:Short C-terminal domain